MQKNMQIKKKHHYVWAFYLKQWASGNDIYYISKKGTVSRDSVNGLSQEACFYTIQALSDEDVAFINLWPTSDNPIAHRFHLSQLDFFKKVSRLISAPNNIKSSRYINELNHLSKVAANNSFENTHTAIETLAKPAIEALCKGNRNFLESKKEMTSFCNYLAHQLFRTKKLKTQYFESMKLLHSTNPNWMLYLRLFEKNWWFISYKMGINLGFHLATQVESANHIFITNNTSIDFITSDFPVINVHEDEQNKDLQTPTEKLDLYYPLSPKFAYMINDSNNYNHLAQTIDEATVKKLNLLISNKSHINIYGTSELALKQLQNSYSDS